MTFAEWVQVMVPIIVALLSLLSAYFAQKGKKKLAKVVDAVTDGIEQAGDSLTKQHVQANAKKLGVDKDLDKHLDKKGFVRGNPSSWKTA